MSLQNSIHCEIYEKLNLDNVVPENDTWAVRQECVVKIGENKEPKISWHFKPTQLGARERKLQYSVTLGK